MALKSKRRMVEAAGIEKASTPIESGTYSRNRCLKSASWTFASAIERGPHPER